jgi:uncharacterized coiled-coil protein SlyX
MVVAFIPLSAAQSKCGSGENDVNGMVKYPGGINATLEFCLPYASKVPELQRSLNEVAKQVGGEKEQLREIKRLMTGLQAVGQNLGEQRQIELLKNFSAQIVSQQAAGQKNQEKIEVLADRLDDLKTLLIEKLGNAGTRDQTTNAINGPVGDAIATFDLAKAHDLLEDIRAQLNVIGGKVDESLKQGKDIKSDTAATRSILEHYQAQEAENQKRYAEMASGRSNDPRLFANVNFVIVKMPAYAALPGVGSNSPPWQIKAIVGHMGTLTDPKLQIAFSSGQKSWLMNATWDGNITWEVNADEIGEKAVVCFSAPDSQTGTRRQWMQSYTVQKAEEAYATKANFIPTGTPTLTPATGAPCGGATDVRESAHIESQQEHTANLLALAQNAKWGGTTQKPEMGSGEANLALARGSQFYNAHLYSEARPLLIRACDAGVSVDACNSVGFIYQGNLGVATDYAKAREYYLKSCNNDSSFSCTNLATLYRDGLGVPQDYARAAMLFEKGCDAGVPEGCVAAGELYMNHLGVAQDNARALELYKKACDGQVAAGCGDVGLIYAEGLVLQR